MKKAQEQIPGRDTLEDSARAIEIETLIESFDFSAIAKAWNHLQTVLLELLPAEAILKEKTAATQLLLQTKVSPIGERFIRQELKSTEGKLSYANLKDRLAKAAAYFLPNLTELHEQVIALHQLATGAPFHTDYFPTLNLILELLAAKIEVFKLLPSISNATEIAKANRTTAISYKPLDSWKQKQSPAEIKIENPELYNELMEWRKKTAETKKSLGYHIISDQAMADISAKLPRTLTQLAKIKNVGEGKTAEYGEQILRLIRQYLGEGELLF